MLLKGRREHRNQIHKLLSPLSEVYLPGSSKMSSLSLAAAALLPPPGTDHCVSSLINNRTAELTRPAISLQDVSGLASLPGINIGDNHHDPVSLLEFLNKNTSPGPPLPSAHSHQLAVSFSFRKLRLM